MEPSRDHWGPASASTVADMADTQHVILSGGSFDGSLAMAPPPPGTLRLGALLDDAHWSELYMYTDGRTAEHPEHGSLPVMIFMEKRGE